MSTENPFKGVEAKAEAKTKRYEVAPGVLVDVSYEEFGAKTNKGKTPELSKSKERDTAERATIFLPGWAVTASDGAMKGLSQAFADSAEGKVYTVTTRSEKVDEKADQIYEEAQAISKFIKERGIKEVTLAGHSQGGDKAINVARILQSDPELAIDGLILLSPVGLYEQKPLGVAGRFAKDTLLDTPPTLAGDVLKNKRFTVSNRGMRAAMDIVMNIVKEIGKSGVDYPKRLKKEVSEMSELNPRLPEIQVPVVIVAGAQDPVSNPRRIVPKMEEEKIMKQWEEEQATEKEGDSIDPREEFLKDNVFPRSPYVRMVIPEKLGHHGLPHFRPESVANASMYLLKRYQRRLRSKSV